MNEFIKNMKAPKLRLRLVPEPAIGGSSLPIDWNMLTKQDILAINWSDLYNKCGEPYEETKPYPNEHACRVRMTNDFIKGSFRRMSRRADNRTLWIIMGKLIGSNTVTTQSFRYPKDQWSSTQAKAHCKRHKGLKFEPAKESRTMIIKPEGMGGIYKIEDESGQEIVVTKELSQQLLEANDNRFEFHCHIKAKEGSERIIEGYANTKHIDRVGDIVRPSAFRKSLKYFKKHGKILLHHIPSQVVGRVMDAKIDDTGLWITAQIARNTLIAEETWENITQKMLDAFSIGFKIIKRKELDPEENEGANRDVQEVDLYETSIVTIPANTGSHFGVAKGILLGSDIMPSFRSSAEFYRFMLEKAETAAENDTLNSDEDDYSELREFVGKLKSEMESLEAGACLDKIRRLRTDIDKL